MADLVGLGGTGVPVGARVAELVGLGGTGVSVAVGCGVLVANGVGCGLHASRRATAIHVKSFKPRRKFDMDGSFFE
jgi:hypothetical protein